jgi:UDP-glucuronate 4-epimerase
MTVIVTGSAGFVGAHLAKELANNGEKVIGIDNFNDYYSSDLKHLRVSHLIPETVETINLDITNRSKLESVVQKLKPSTIYHLAAQPGIRLGLSKNEQYVQSNLVGFSNVLEFAIKHQIPNFIYASSSSVYGNSVNVPFSEADREIEPISFYGASKLANEFLASSLVRGSKTNTRGLRFFTVYGPWGRPDMAYLRIAEALQNGSEFKLFGDGQVIRDFTYIDDIVSSTIKLAQELDTREKTGYSDIVNIGGGKPSSMNELITTFEAICGRKLMITQLDHVMKDVKQTIASLDRQNKLIQSTPSATLESGVKEVIQWAESPLVASKLRAWTLSVD